METTPGQIESQMNKPQYIIDDIKFNMVVVGKKGLRLEKEKYYNLVGKKIN